ncbi:MAG: sigma-54 dependent transcriptional regulator [Bacteroidales bacterium]|nr:sigma-54 dependent transcriptional regulator [Bacteroidales bacterium]
MNKAEIQSIKQRFGIIGNSPLLDHAIDIARQVAPTDLTVLITGESGTGKEFFPKIIHHYSHRKHGPFIAVNCGAIPEGTIDSELFGHEKGSFTGAYEARKGYFEVVNGGTIFLDEVGDLPLGTQVRLLRVLETGEFIRVGSSKVLKTDVRVVAATNVNLVEAIKQGKFREDLFYRLNTVPIHIPPLRERRGDIVLLFNKFALDFAEKYRIPPIELTQEATQLLTQAYWHGNVRQLKNVAEQISIIEKERVITPEILRKYIQDITTTSLPALKKDSDMLEQYTTDREIVFKFLADMKKDIQELKRVVSHIIAVTGVNPSPTFKQVEHFTDLTNTTPDISFSIVDNASEHITSIKDVPAEIIKDDEPLSLEKKEMETIKKALEKYKGKRKLAAKELGISERTLYRKIKQYNLNM